MKKQKTSAPKTKSAAEYPDNIEVLAKRAHVKPEQAAKIIAMSWSGPLPPPDILNAYPPAIQNAIVAQAKSQMKHRQNIESSVISSNIKNSGWGMKFAFIITSLMILGGIFLISIDKSAEGLAAIFVPTGFQAGNFLLQRFKGFNKMKRDAEDENNSAIKGIKNE